MKTKQFQQFVVGKTLGIALLIVVPCFEVAAVPLLNSANGHYYDLIDASTNWDDANTAASSLTYLGIFGHLVTITDAQENFFLTSTFGSSALHLHWMGGLQPVGSSEPDGGWSWLTSEVFAFSNWWPGEPNNNGGTEDRIIFDHGVTANGKSWNDYTGGWNANGYVVEFDTATVPEPTTLALLAFGALVGPFRRRSMRRAY